MDKEPYNFRVGKRNGVWRVKHFIQWYLFLWCFNRSPFIYYQIIYQKYKHKFKIDFYVFIWW